MSISGKESRTASMAFKIFKVDLNPCYNAMICTRDGKVAANSMNTLKVCVCV